MDDKRAFLSVRTSVWLVPLTFSSLVGCADGPFFELKKLNPVIQNQWKKDRERGPVFSQRVDEMRLLKSQFKSMSDGDQAKWVSSVGSIVQTETSPEFRREAALALGEVIERPDAASIIVKLAQDKDSKVRLCVAELLRKHASPETTQTLLALSTSDADTSVRLAAVESLGSHQTEEVKQFLAKQLNDRSPAMQFATSNALKEFTGKDFRDVALWKRYLAGENVEPPTSTFLQAVQPYVPFLR